MDIRYLLVLKKHLTLSIILLIITYLVVIDFFENRVKNLPAW
jgi:hypothetical protein